MSQLYLINDQTFTDYEDLSPNIKGARILVFVKKMQELDLKLFLDHPFYYDLIKYITTTVPGVIEWAEGTPQAYKDLVEGCEYQDPHGHTIIYEGLIPAMVYFTFARFVEKDSIRYTATGPVYKNHDNAQPLSMSDLVKNVQMIRSEANAHCNEVQKFLYDNKKDFPLWRYSESNNIARQPGPRIRAIDKTKFNYPNGYNNYGYNIGFNDLL